MLGGGGRRRMRRREGGGQISFQIWFICDLDLAAQIPRALFLEKFYPCVFVYAGKLTSYSVMAVDVEAEVSATKRSQVEVTKILPEWTEGKEN